MPFSLDVIRHALSLLKGGGPSNFFQTRVTQTPGVVDPKLPTPAQYAAPGDVNIADAVMRSSLPLSQKNQLLLGGYGGRKGFISARPDAPSTAMRHEQVHDVYGRGGLGKSAPQIAPLVDKGLEERLHEIPIYQQLAKDYGWPAIIANEGTAYGLTGETPNVALRDFLVKQLSGQGKTREASQMTRLTTNQYGR